MTMNNHAEFERITRELIHAYAKNTSLNVTHMLEICELDGFDSMFTAALQGLAKHKISIPAKLHNAARTYVQQATAETRAEELQYLQQIQTNTLAAVA